MAAESADELHQLAKLDESGALRETLIAGGVFNETGTIDFNDLRPVVDAAVSKVVSQQRIKSKIENANAEISHRMLTTRVFSHLRTEENLANMEQDISETLEKGLRTRNTLESLESRIKHLRATLASTSSVPNNISSASGSSGSTDGVILNPKSLGRAVASKNISEQIDMEIELETGRAIGVVLCPKCNGEFLAGFLDGHVQVCDGFKQELESSSDDGSDSSDYHDSDSAPSDQERNETSAVDAAGSRPAFSLRSSAKQREKERDNLQQCPMCLRNYTKSRIEAHLVSCKRRLNRLSAAAAARGVALQASGAASRPPDAPSSLRSVGTTASTISLVWESPVYDGGAPIFEYELSFSRLTKVRLGKKEYRYETVPQPPVNTSRWYLSAPVAHRGFLLHSLACQSTYSDIKVRAVNSAGPGPWSQPIEAKTTDPVPPSRPLHLRTCDVTAESFLLQWEPPLDNGGAGIAQYELRMEQSVPDFASAVRLGVRDGSRSVELVMTIPGTLVEFRVENLLGSTTYSNIYLVAVAPDGTAGLPSVPVGPVQTLKMTRVQELRFELKKVVERKELEIEVYHNKLHQVMNRLAYIDMLRAELKELEQLESEQAPESRVSDNSGVDIETELNNALSEGSMVVSTNSPHNSSSSALVVAGSGTVPPLGGSASAATLAIEEEDPQEREYDIRRAHFEYRIYFIEKKLAACSASLLSILERRTQLKHILTKVNRRWRDVYAELDFLKEYKGHFVDSPALHGGLQRFATSELKEMLEEERVEVETTLAAARREMLGLIELSKSIVLERDTQENNLRERKSALLLLDKEEVRRRRARQLTDKFLRRGVPWCFRMWKEYVLERRRVRLLLRRVVAGLSRSSTAAALRTWRQFVRFEKQQEALRAAEDAASYAPGAGSALLNRALELRNVMLDDVTSLLAWLGGVQRDLDASEASLAQRRALRSLEGSEIGLKPMRKPVKIDIAQSTANASIGGSTRASGILDSAATRVGTAPLSDSLAPLSSVPPLRLETGTRSSLIAPGESEDPRDRLKALAGVAKAHAAVDEGSPDQLILDGIIRRGVQTARQNLVAIQNKKNGLSNGPNPPTAPITSSSNSGEGIKDAFGRVIKRGPADVFKNPAFLQRLYSHVQALLVRARSLLAVGRWAECQLPARQAEIVFGFLCDAPGLLACYRVLSLALERGSRFDLAEIHWLRCWELAQEVSVRDPMLVAEALEGRARCLLELSHPSDALRMLEQAEDIYEARNDMPALSRVLALVSRAQTLRGEHARAAKALERSQKIKNSQNSLLSRGLERLRKLESLMVGLGVRGSRLLQLEPVASSVPLLRQQKKFVSQRIRKSAVILEATEAAANRLNQRSAAIRRDQQRAEAAAGGTVESTLLSGATQTFNAAELLKSLKIENIKVAEDLMEAERAVAVARMQHANLQDELNELQQYLDTEAKPYMMKIHSRRPLRAIGLNMSNWRANNVLGVNSGGFPYVAAAADQQIFVYSLMDGSAVNSFSGDVGDHTGHAVGHSKSITCLAYWGTRIFSGSADCTVRVWDAGVDRGWGRVTPVTVRRAERARQKAEKEEQKRNLYFTENSRGVIVDGRNVESGEVAAAPDGDAAAGTDSLKEFEESMRETAGEVAVLQGHEATVTCISVGQHVVVTGGADSVLIVWDLRTFQLIRRLRGHELGITALDMEGHAFVSGSADRELRLWELVTTAPGNAGVKSGGSGSHLSKVTSSSVSINPTLISRKNPYRSIQQVRRYKGHNATITTVCIRGFDIVSGAADGEIIMWDSKSPLALRRLHVHGQNPVHCLVFDPLKIVSYGGDNKLLFLDAFTGDILQTTHRPHGESPVMAVTFDVSQLLTVAADRSVRVWTLRGEEPAPIMRQHVVAPKETLLSISKKYECSIQNLMQWNKLSDEKKVYAGMRLVVKPTLAVEEAKFEEVEVDDAPQDIPAIEDGNITT